MATPRMCDKSLLTRDLSGKRYVVTGANSGIGKTTAVQLTKQGAEVIFACRRLDNGQRVIATLSDDQQSRAHAMRLDLGDLSSIRGFSRQFHERFESLTGLVNNAGVMNTPKGLTRDGFETQFGVNHLGHFLLTQLLTDSLSNGSPSRIVNVSSCYHDKAVGREGTINFEDLHFTNRPYDGWEAYAQSKLANLLHARSLAKRLVGTDVTAVSVHPGWVRTNLAKHTMPVFIQDTLMRPVFSLMGMIDPWEGAQTSLHALLADDVPDHAGAFFSQLHEYY